MEEKKFCDVIVELRKKNGFTQQELASKLNITDKAVSKWERGLSYPDITSISTLAKVLGVDSSYLIDLCKKEGSENPYQKEDVSHLVHLIGTALGIAMGVAVIVLSILEKLQTDQAIVLLAIGLFGISLASLLQNHNSKSE